MTAAERRIALISNVLLVVGLVLLFLAFGAHTLFEGTGSKQRIWTRALSLAAAVIFLAAMAVGWRDVLRWLRGRATQEGLVSLAFTVAMWAIIVFGIYLGARYTLRHDATQERVYSLSEKTVRVVRELTEPVEVYASLKKTTGSVGQEQKARDLIALYESLAARNPGKLRIERLNPDRHRTRLTQLGMDKEDVAILVRAGGTAEGKSWKAQKLSLYDATEQKLTSAILNVTTPEKKKIYFLEGHGELSIEEPGGAGLSKLKQLLEEDQYEVATLSLGTEGTVPSDARIIAIIGAQYPIPEEELQAISDWVDTGGRLLIMPENRALRPDAPDFEQLLNRWDIAIRADVVEDEGSYLITPQIVAVQGKKLGSHPITTPSKTTNFYFDPQTSSLRVTERAQPRPGEPPPPQTGANTVSLVKTTDLARGLADPQKGPSSADTPGPLTIAAASEITIHPDTSSAESEDKPSEQKAKVVVIADPLFAVNGDLVVAGRRLPRLANHHFVRNAVHWLAEAEDLIAIPPKDQTPPVLSPSKQQVAWNRLLAVLGPVIPLFIGMAVWFMRRG